MTYAEKLKHPKWQKKRLEILERDSFTCSYCGDTETTLHVHHLEYKGKNPWDTPSDSLVCACEDCHEFLEGIKKRYSNPPFITRIIKFPDALIGIGSGSIFFDTELTNLTLFAVEYLAEYIKDNSDSIIR